MITTEKTPLVSVLMPAYNSENYIAIAIESVLNSTYKNFELIVTDDNSSDNTLIIAQKYEKIDKRVKVFLNDKNYGDYPNRNQAAFYANGEYLKYVDHDDYIYPYGLEQLVYYMEQFPQAGYGLCSIKQDRTRIFPFQLSPKEAYEMNYFETEIFDKAPLSSIIRKSAFNDIGGFTGKPFLGDFELWLLLSQKFPVLLMPHGIIWYRRHDSQESNRMRRDPVHNFNYYVIGKEMISSENCPLDECRKQQIIDSYNKKQGRAILSAAKHHSIKKAIQLQKLSGQSTMVVFKNILRSFLE